MSILTKVELIKYLSYDQSIEQRLFISPLLEKDQIGDTSIDLRLGHRFSVPKPSRLGLLNIMELRSEGEGILERNYSESRVPYGHYFTLHPKRSVQIGTLEYLGIPNDLEGVVTLRASVSNLPIVANTAQVHPGHRGIISLTLTNNAEFSIALYPGLKIAELKLYHVDTAVVKPKSSRYHHMIGPLHTALYRDQDLEYLRPMIEPIIIGITSTIAAGRTTAINYLTEEQGFTWFSLGQVLKEEALKNGIPTLRSNLQQFGNQQREVHGDSYLAYTLRNTSKWQTNKNHLVVVDSFKHPAEAFAFRKHKRFALIGIDAPVEERWKRVKERRRHGDPETYQDFLKQDNMDRGIGNTSSHSQHVKKLLEMADYKIENNGTIAEFKEELKQIVNDIIYS